MSALSLVCALFAGRASALAATDPGSQRKISRAPDAHRCLEVQAVEREVEQWLGHPLEPSWAVVLRGSPGFGFDLYAGTRKLGERRFDDEQQPCEQIIQILGLAIAVAIEDQVLEAIAPALGELDTQGEPAPAVAQYERTERAPALHRGGWVELGPVLAGSSLPTWGVELGVALAWRGPVRVRSELTLDYRPAIELRADSLPSAQAFSLGGDLAAALCAGEELGARPISIEMCLGARGGVWFARGTRLAPNTWGLAGWLATSGGFFVSVPTQTASYDLGLELLAAAVEPSLRTTDPDGASAQLFSGARLGGRLSLRVMFEITRARRSSPTGHGPPRQ